MNLCDVALDAFLWFDEFMAPCYLLQLSYCGCSFSWYYIPISRITPIESHHPPPDIHTWPLLTPLRSESSDSPQAKKHSISCLAFHLKNKVVLLINGQGLFLVFRPPAMKQLLSVRGSSSRALVTPREKSDSPESLLLWRPSSTLLLAIMFRRLYGKIMFLAEMADELQPASFLLQHATISIFTSYKAEWLFISKVQSKWIKMALYCELWQVWILKMIVCTDNLKHRQTIY